MDALERLWFRLQYIARRAVLTLIDDSKPVQFVQATMPGGEVFDGLPRVAEYGLQSVPPVGAEGVVVYMAGNASDGVVIATGHLDSRPTGLQRGEVILYDDLGQFVKLTRSGMVIGAPLGLTVNGDTVFNGSVYANGKRIDDQHHHVPDSHGDTQGVVA